MLKDEFEVEYMCKKGTESYINMFCHEIKDDYERVEMFYDDDENSDDDDDGHGHGHSNGGHDHKSKKNSDYLGSFVIVFSVIDKSKNK